MAKIVAIKNETRKKHAERYIYFAVWELTKFLVDDAEMMNFQILLCSIYCSIPFFIFARVFVPMTAHLCHGVLLFDRWKKRYENVALKTARLVQNTQVSLFIVCILVVFSYFWGSTFKIDSPLAIFTVVACGVIVHASLGPVTFVIVIGAEFPT